MMSGRRPKSQHRNGAFQGGGMPPYAGMQTVNGVQGIPGMFVPIMPGSNNFGAQKFLYQQLRSPEKPLDFTLGPDAPQNYYTGRNNDPRGWSPPPMEDPYRLETPWTHSPEWNRSPSKTCPSPKMPEKRPDTLQRRVSDLTDSDSRTANIINQRPGDATGPIAADTSPWVEVEDSLGRLRNETPPGERDGSSRRVRETRVHPSVGSSRNVPWERWTFEGGLCNPRRRSYQSLSEMAHYFSHLDADDQDDIIGLLLYCRKLEKQVEEQHIMIDMLEQDLLNSRELLKMPPEWRALKDADLGANEVPGEGYIPCSKPPVFLKGRVSLMAPEANEASAKLGESAKSAPAAASKAPVAKPAAASPPITVSKPASEAPEKEPAKAAPAAPKAPEPPKAAEPPKAVGTKVEPPKTPAPLKTPAPKTEALAPKAKPPPKADDAAKAPPPPVSKAPLAKPGLPAKPGALKVPAPAAKLKGPPLKKA